MRDVLGKKLVAYIRDNNPEIFAELSEVSSISAFIETKVNAVEDMLKQLEADNTPVYITEELCMAQMTRDLKPSKYNYILHILEEDFEFAYQQLLLCGVLQTEVINMIRYCNPVFETLLFTEEHEDNPHLRSAITGVLNDYLINN